MLVPIGRGYSVPGADNSYPQAPKISLATRRELLNKPLTRIPADDSAFEVPQMLDAAGKWGHWEGGVTLQTSDGHSIEGRGAIAFLAGGENHSGGYLLISNLEHSPAGETGTDSMLAEVSARLRALAHDLNNPLAVMMGFTQLLSLDAACPATVQADIQKVHSELKRVVEFVEKLHGYAVSLCEKPPRKESGTEASRPGVSARSGEPASNAGNPSKYETEF
jgi:signal transduction histidine kinase